jgi:hypothetical protein
MKSYQDLKEKTLAMTAFFETSNTYPECYGITAGNWDLQGLSHGVLQYNFGTGSLQPLWNYLNTTYNQLCRNVFGADYQEWADILGKTTEEQVAWADGISDSATGKHSVVQPWKDYFMNLGTSQESIDKQIDMSAAWRTNAEKWFASLGLYSRRGFALLWDISVQMGRLFPQNLIWNDFTNINVAGKTRQQIEEEKLRIIVNRCSYEENRVTDPAIQTIVYNRKIAIVDGTSNQGFNIVQYDLDYDPAFKGGIFSG